MKFFFRFSFLKWPSSEETSKRLVTQSQATWFQQLMGFGAVLMATLTSGFAGVYFEKILKTGPTSVWVRNIQLAIFGTIFGLVIVVCFDYKAVMDKGFFQGYTTIVWIVIVLQVHYISKDFIEKNLIFSRLLVV